MKRPPTIVEIVTNIPSNMFLAKASVISKNILLHKLGIE